MGDTRFEQAFEKLRRARDQNKGLQELSDDEVVQALAWCSIDQPDPFLANVLATEAANRFLRLKLALVNMGEGVFAVDAKGHVTYANPEAERATGWSLAELRGRPLSQTIHPHAAPPLVCTIDRVLSGGDRCEEEAESFRRKDGSMFPVSYTIAPIRTESGITGGILTFRDITEKTAQRAALHESQERFRVLSEAAREAIIIHVDGHIREANVAALNLVGATREQVLGRTVMDFIDPTVSLETVQKALAQRTEMAYRVIALRLDGTTFPAHVHATNVTYLGKPARAVIIHPDPEPE